ncbi:conserved domain protein [Enterococcus faecalis TX1467]|nr:conserved domain protein [Enterococcus faecalis TX1467]
MFMTLDIGAIPSIRINGDNTTSIAIIKASNVTLWIRFFYVEKNSFLREAKGGATEKDRKTQPQINVVGCNNRSKFQDISLRQS